MVYAVFCLYGEGGKKRATRAARRGSTPTCLHFALFSAFWLQWGLLGPPNLPSEMKLHPTEVFMGCWEGKRGTRRPGHLCLSHTTPQYTATLPLERRKRKEKWKTTVQGQRGLCSNNAGIHHCCCRVIRTRRCPNSKCSSRGSVEVGGVWP